MHTYHSIHRHGTYNSIHRHRHPSEPPSQCQHNLNKTKIIWFWKFSYFRIYQLKRPQLSQTIGKCISTFQNWNFLLPCSVFAGSIFPLERRGGTNKKKSDPVIGVSAKTIDSLTGSPKCLNHCFALIFLVFKSPNLLKLLSNLSSLFMQTCHW